MKNLPRWAKVIVIVWGGGLILYLTGGMKDSRRWVKAVSIIWSVWALITLSMVFSRPSFFNTPEKPAKIKSTKERLVDEVKEIDGNITSVDLVEQVDPKTMKYNGTYLFEIDLKTPTLLASYHDWVNVAMITHNIAEKLLVKPEFSRAHLTFFYKEDDNTNLDWAHVWINKTSMPPNWGDLNYLEFFSHVRPDPGCLSSQKWLDKFYEKVPFAKPVSL